ncbi:hypothetical protein [Flavobacterium sp.]|uniref:hypothetical protein n=1 Tax=Flavobacterium sp. TaxID=239 RepID=UPI002FD9997B
MTSKSYLFPLLFSFLGILFSLFWILAFTHFVIFGSDFSLTNLILLPVLLIPLWILYVLEGFLNTLTFTKEGVIIYKMLFLRYKCIHWKSLDYSFETTESGKGSNSQVIYLVKNKKLIMRISDVNYKNYFDIYNYINSNIENKGTLKLTLFDSFKYFTKGTIPKLP